jgi:glycerol-3-phosphate acyltransferase PlsY
MRWLILIFAFLSGAIPTGFIVVWLTKRINIQKVGSGNIGSTNVGRVAGKGPALITQAVDVLKGFVPTLLAILYNRAYPTPYFVEITALLTILGHDFTPYLLFRGGKGVNTTFGAFLPMFPLAGIIAFLSHLVVRKTLRIVSVASMVAGLVFSISATLIYGWSTRTLALVVAFGILLFQHRANLVRLAKNQEPREERKK